MIYRLSVMITVNYFGRFNYVSIYTHIVKSTKIINGNQFNYCNS